jgi:hypothetical protein
VVPRCAAPGSFRAPARALALPAAVGWACSLRAPVLSPPLRATGKGAPLPLGAAALPPSPLSLLTARLRRGGAAVLLKNKLGDLRGAVERLREVLAAARANPDMGPAHADTTRYAGALAKWEALATRVEARELRFNPQSPWVAWACGARCMYWRNGPLAKSLEAPAEGVKEYAEKERSEFDKYHSSWFPQ